jgi:alpha-mannosidase
MAGRLCSAGILPAPDLQHGADRIASIYQFRSCHIPRLIEQHDLPERQLLPMARAPHADEGRHEFTYSFYPHGGNWRDALTVRRGYELNYPLLVRRLEKHKGELKDEYSFLQLQPDNVVLTATKKAEDGNWLILRFYEWAGKESDVKLRLPAGALEASEIDLMERPLGTLSLQDGGVTVHTKPYEIKALRVRFAAKSSEQSSQSH